MTGNIIFAGEESVETDSLFLGEDGQNSDRTSYCLSSMKDWPLSVRKGIQKLSEYGNMEIK